MHMVCMSRDVADGAVADIGGTWPLKPGLELGPSGTGLARGLVERLLKGVVDEDVFDGTFAEPCFDEAPLACGVEIAGMEASVRAGGSAAREEVADVDIPAGLVAAVLIERTAMRSAGVADLDPRGVFVVVVEDVEGVQELVGGVLRHVGAGALANDEARVRWDDDSVHERAAIGASDGLGGWVLVVGEDAEFDAFAKSWSERIPALNGVDVDTVAGGDVREGFAAADAVDVKVALSDDELLALADALQRGVAVERLELGEGEPVAPGDASCGVAGDDAVADVGQFGGGGCGVDDTGADHRERE